MFMPDLSDVGPPATGPGLPARIPDAPPPPVVVRIVHAENPKALELLEKFTSGILEVAPDAKLTTEFGDDDTFEVEINEKLIFSRKHLGEYPNVDDIVEIAKWGNRGKSFLHMYLCSVAEGGEPKMVLSDRKNTPLPKRIIMMCVIS